MSFSGGNWGSLVSGFPGAFLGGESLVTPGSGLPQGHGSPETCLSAVSLENMTPYLHRQDLTLEVERERVKDHTH